MIDHLTRFLEQNPIFSTLTKGAGFGVSMIVARASDLWGDVSTISISLTHAVGLVGAILIAANLGFDIWKKWRNRNK